jgi:phosphate transport system substrate-binding protein
MVVGRCATAVSVATAVVWCIVALASGAVAEAAAPSTAISGAGSSLLAPLESEWATGFKAVSSDRVAYSPIDSLNGIDDLLAHNVDFAASDAPLNQAQATDCSSCVQIPWALSAVGIGYHIGGFSGPLRLSGRILAEIYLGQIKMWNNPQIKALNPGAALPNLRITPIYRNDGAGSTYAFTDFLGETDGTWARKEGSPNPEINFPLGDGAQGDFGSSGVLKSINGAIAYIAAPYLAGEHLPAAAVENAAGRFEYPNLRNIQSAAAATTSLGADGTISIVNPPRTATTAYPIATYSYAVVNKKDAKLTAVRAFVEYALTAGQAFGPALDFGAIPATVLAAARAAAQAL